MHPFDSASFGELAADADRLAANASGHEGRLASLVNALEADGDSPLLHTLRALCVGAREQRQIADTLRKGLIGNVAAPNSEEALKRPLVLIVDDSPDNRDMAATETSGFDTITAAVGSRRNRGALRAPP
jgi:hypothetical protein